MGNLQRSNVIHDKAEVSLGDFVGLASYSHILKASATQLLPPDASSQQQSEPRYPDAHGATRTDMILCGLHLPNANHVTSTGVPVNPADEHVLSEYALSG
jgi:hypothetical protein